MTDQSNGPISGPDRTALRSFFASTYVRTALVWGVPLVLVCGLVLALGIPWIIVGIALVVFGVLLFFS